MEGRDIGTNVFLDAAVKVLLTARPEVRAARRAAELRAKGDPVADDEVLAAVASATGGTRSVSRPAALRRGRGGGRHLAMTLDEVVDAVVGLVREKVGG